jgi:hypothetical protein
MKTLAAGFEQFAGPEPEESKMSTRIRQAILMLGIAAPVAMGLAAPASAGLFDGIGKAVGGVTKGVSRAVGGAAKDVSRTVGKATKSVGHAAGSVTRNVGRAAGSVSRDVRRAIPKIGKTYMKVARPVGTVVSKYYNYAGKAAEHIPVLGKPAASLARDISRAAKTKEAQIGAGVGAGVALLGGGLGALRYVGTAAGGGAMTGYYGKQTYEAGKRTAKQFDRRVRKDADDIRRSFR